MEFPFASVSRHGFVQQLLNKTKFVIRHALTSRERDDLLIESTVKKSTQANFAFRSLIGHVGP